MYNVTPFIFQILMTHTVKYMVTVSVVVLVMLVCVFNTPVLPVGGKVKMSLVRSYVQCHPIYIVTVSVLVWVMGVCVIDF